MSKINIEIPQLSKRQITKRNVLSYIESINDHLGLISARHIIGKSIYRVLWDLKIPRDEETPDILKGKFKKYVQDISNNETVLPRAIPLKLESVTVIDLQVFEDASILVNCASVCISVYQPSIKNKGLLVSKSGISKKDVIIPRLELVSAHIDSNLVFNVLSAVKTENIRLVVGWTESTVVLCWLSQSESYEPFVANSVSKIKQIRYVPTKPNPAYSE